MITPGLAARNDDEDLKLPDPIVDPAPSPAMADVAPTADVGAATAPISAPPPIAPSAGTTTPEPDLAAAIADADAGPDLGPPKLEPVPDLTPTPGPPSLEGVAADQAKAADAAVIAERNAAKVRQEGLRQEELIRAQTAEDQRKHAERVEAVIADHDKRLNDMLARKQQYFDDARNSQYHDLWADRSTGDRVLGAIAVFLGGLGGGQNQAMQILDKRMQAAYDKQAHDIEGKWKLYAEQSKDIDAAEAGLKDSLSNLKFLQSARYDAAADQLERLKIRQGIPADQAKSDKDVVAIRQKALEVRSDEAEQIRKAAEAATKLDLEKKLNEAQIRHLDAMSDKLERVPTGGAGGKSSKQRLAEQKAQQADERILTQDVKDFRKESGYNDFAKQADTALSVQNRLKNPDINGAEAAGLLMALDSAHRGGVATAVSVDQVMGHLGGAADKVAAWVQKNKDGKLPPQYVEVLRDVAANLVNDRQKQIAKAHDDFVRRFYVEDPKYSQDPFLHDKVTANAAAMFGRFGFKTDKQRAAEAAAKPENGATPTSGGSATVNPPVAGATRVAPKPEIPADETERKAKAQRALRALNDSTKTAAQKEAARQYLVSIGAR